MISFFIKISNINNKIRKKLNKSTVTWLIKESPVETDFGKSSNKTPMLEFGGKKCKRQLLLCSGTSLGSVFNM